MATPRAAPGAMRRDSTCALLVVVLAGARPACAATADLVPAPRSIELAGGPGRISATCVLRSESPREDVYAMRMLRGLLPRAGAGTIARVSLRAAHPASTPDGAIADESYALEIGRDAVVVTGATRAARLHGVETLRQLWLLGDGALTPGRIVDGPALRVRGLSVDVSRGRMPTAADLVAMLDLCAEFKLNVFQLYFEDAFRYSRVPATAIPPWALDPLVLRRVAAEARLRAIEFVPIVQTLAHQERLLARPGMSAYAERDGASMFAITRPATRDLVASMVDDLLAATGSGAIHLGCDEATEIGLGASAARGRRDGAEAIFRDHVETLARHARERWGARAWIYADQLRAHPGLAETLPRDLVLVDWDYDPGTQYASLDSLARAGLERVITSPALWDWCTVHPDYGRACANIAVATRAARAHGCLGSVLSSWGDHGGECLFGNAVMGVAYFADCAWHGDAVERDAFLPRYCRLRFGDAAPGVEAAFRALEQVQLPGGAYLDRLLDHPILLRTRTPEWRDAVTAIAQDVTRARAALAGTSGRDLYADAELGGMSAATARLDAAADRERTLDALAGAIGAAPTGEPAAQARAATELARLATAAGSAQAVYARAWSAHNETSGLEPLRAEFARQRAVLDSLRDRAARRELRLYEPPRPVAGD